MKFRPLHDRVVVRRIEAEEKKAGDRVLFGKWSGTEVRIDGQDLLIMKESDIMGIVG
jgi:chaperonin GroES